VRHGTRGFGLKAQGEFVLPFKNRLVAGLSVEHQSLYDFALLANSVPITNVNAGMLTRPEGLRLPTEDGRGARGPAADRLGFGLFVGDTWTPVEVVSVHAGLRFDLTQLPRGDSFGQWTGSTFVPSFGPRLGLTVTPVRSLVLRGYYGRSYRAPTVQELADPVPNNDFNQGRFVGNPQLEGAYIDSVEAGAEYLQGLGEGKLRLKGNAFFERISNAIVQVDTSGNLVPYANRLLGVQAVGLEGEARLELTRRLSGWVNVSWVRAEDLTTPQQARILTDVPQIRVNGGVSLPIGKFLNVDLVGRYVSERRNNSRSVLELIRRYTLPGYATFTAQLRTEPLFDHLELVVLGQNVFNFEYADDAYRPDRVTAGVPRETWQVFGQAKVSF
jgi:outer membrane receptor protein involved in Fe transport